MELTVEERYAIIRLYPSEGTVLEMKARKRVARDCEVRDAAEKKRINFQEYGARGVGWDAELSKGALKDVEFSSIARDTICKAIKARIKEDALFVKLAEKFFSGSELDGLVKTTLVELDKAGKITEGHLELVEKYCPDLAVDEESPKPEPGPESQPVASAESAPSPNGQPEPVLAE